MLKSAYSFVSCKWLGIRSRLRHPMQLPWYHASCIRWPVTGEFPAQMASNAENFSIWWRHHGSCMMFSTRMSIKERPHGEVLTHKPLLATRHAPTLTNCQSGPVLLWKPVYPNHFPSVYCFTQPSNHTIACVSDEKSTFIGKRRGNKRIVDK